ncbi:MAG: T9SS type A sorting domain-containing protein, partial [Ekhidna sp.]|nr:T9SS type A sorting domain-containing protein [Ekhidna sp.]
RVFPNPASGSFNVGLNLPQKEPITISLIDMSGKIVFQNTIGNGLNQILTFKAPSQRGLYFVQITGSNFNASQKLFINR